MDILAFTLVVNISVVIHLLYRWVHCTHQVDLQYQSQRC